MIAVTGSDSSAPGAGVDRLWARRQRWEAGMAEEVTERVSRYIHDGTDEDLRRLLRMAEHQAELARAAFRRVGVQQGWNAIDCGCGPLGGLAVLAEMVGPASRVVGVDVSQAAVQRARAAVAALELSNVEVVAGDLDDLDAAALGGPFDLAFTRNFLTHQTDPVRTLRHIADLLHPGGWLVTQEPLPSPPPRSHPHLEAVTGAWDLWRELLFTRLEYRLEPSRTCPGPQAKRPLRSLRRTAPSWSTTRSRDSSNTQPPSRRSENAASNRASQPERIDGLVRDLRAAEDGAYEWTTSPFYLGLALHKPAA